MKHDRRRCKIVACPTCRRLVLAAMERDQNKRQAASAALMAQAVDEYMHDPKRSSAVPFRGVLTPTTTFGQPPQAPPAVVPQLQCEHVAAGAYVAETMKAAMHVDNVSVLMRIPLCEPCDNVGRHGAALTLVTDKGDRVRVALRGEVVVTPVKRTTVTRLAPSTEAEHVADMAEIATALGSGRITPEQAKRYATSAERRFHERLAPPDDSNIARKAARLRRPRVVHSTGEVTVTS